MLTVQDRKNLVVNVHDQVIVMSFLPLALNFWWQITATKVQLQQVGHKITYTCVDSYFLYILTSSYHLFLHNVIE